MTIKVAINDTGPLESASLTQWTLKTTWRLLVTKPPFLRLRSCCAKGLPAVLHVQRPRKNRRFLSAGYACHGECDDLLAVADVVVDCSPGKVGAANKEAYVRAGVKYIFRAEKSMPWRDFFIGQPR